MRLHAVHRIPLGAERFWAILHSAPYEAAVAEALGLRTYRELERREDEREIYRRIEMVAELPEPLRGILARVPGAAAGAAGLVRSTEEQWRSRSERRVRWKTTPAYLSGRVRLEGEVRVSPVDADHCDRILEGVVEVRVFGLGGLVERALAGAIESTYARSAEVARRFREPDADAQPEAGGAA